MSRGGGSEGVEDGSGEQSFEAADRFCGSLRVCSFLRRVCVRGRRGRVGGSFGDTRTSSSPRQSSCRSSQGVNSLQSSSAHSRSASSAAAQPSSSSLPTATVRSSSIRPASSTATAVTDCLCTSTPTTIIPLASNSRWGRQVTLDGHRSAAATQRWMVRPTERHSESSQPPPESAPATGRCRPTRMTLSSGMTRERHLLSSTTAPGDNPAYGIREGRLRQTVWSVRRLARKLGAGCRREWPGGRAAITGGAGYGRR